ncbi:UPF0481 protein [Salvia divinorum]|uniref:UPF0481 protein n=1 Tax=Salvia divinorum TaxID=28513 RepID=A0ABD1IHA8_SALDI
MADIDEEPPGEGAVGVDIPDIVEETPAAVKVGIPKSQPHMLYKVPVQVKRDKKYIYEPEVVPLGPYHHRGHPQLQLVEPLKNELLDMICTDAVRKNFLLSKICERIHEIKHFYGGADGYDDKELSEMMLRDACFLICNMQGSETSNLIRRRLGMSGMLFMYRDIRMLENQIPLWLIALIHPDHESLLSQYLNLIVYGDDIRTTRRNEGGEELVVFGGYTRITQLPWGNGNGEEPLHLLDAWYRILLGRNETREKSSCFSRIIKKCNQASAGKRSSTTVWRMVNSPFRSATDLKAKGIHFRRSSHCLTDIKFFSFAFYAELQLPSFYVTNSSKVYFSNLIAFEMSPEREPVFGLTCYFNFMKALIHNANDVKVLREKGILYGLLPSDEDVVQLFKSIDTYGYPNRGLFLDVKMRIEEHCNNKARRWMADLINTNFRSPWTVIALVAATFLLCLTFLQTYFTINPRN